ncbi:polyamine ABC transporter substrate-binding protein [Sphaerisporangium fuscum]|uniref:polyamine ABC transporter substrate-binding protein n=1 Tax=Sphaerisporangium fuscum TaxID=2835868 RepID=UPI001BDC964F|nr:spermidine/putrescine ABC transporter substrate-binding protein [Sphaerisporangium fuscum]
MPRTRYARRLPAAVAAAGLALTLTSCGGAGSSGADGAATAGDAARLDPKADLKKQSLAITIWDGYSPADLPQKVQEKLGFPVKVAIHDTNETAMAKLTAGGETVDVAFVSGQYAQALAEQGLLEPLHPELIPNLANLYPEASQLSFDKGTKFAVPYTWGTTGICYRSDLVKTPPTSWNDLLNFPADLKGKVTMMTTERWLALPALKMLGYSVNTADDNQLAQAKDLLLKAKKAGMLYDDTTFGKKLEDGQAALVEAWDGWCPTKNPKIKFTVPKEGSDLWSDTMVIMKSSRNKEAAHAFVNYILDPAVHSWVAQNILYKVPNKAAMELVAKSDGKLLDENPPLRMSAAELLKGESIVDLGEDSTKYTRLATEIQAASQ